MKLEDNMEIDEIYDKPGETLLLSVAGQGVNLMITAPLAGKNIEDAICPLDHLESAREFLSSCSKFLIIGSTGLDAGLMTFLKNAVRVAPTLYVQLVDHKRGAIAAVDRFKRTVPAFYFMQQP